MRNNQRIHRLLALLLSLTLAAAFALPAFAEGEEPAAPEAPSESTATEIPPTEEQNITGASTVYVGEIATQIQDKWECASSFPVKGSIPKSYETMVGNVLRLTVYSTVPQDNESNFYIPLDSHISYVDGTDRFTMTGKSGEYYCYEKMLRVTDAGSFDLTVINTNATLYSGLYDTIAVTAYDTIDSLDFFVEQSIEDSGSTTFFVTANGSATTLITPDTTGFNASDNEWKIVTAEKSEKVLFSDTTYKGYSFDPQVITLGIRTDEAAQADPVSIQVYYLGLINGKLFTVGPYTFPASANTYSSTFELGASRMDVLATEGKATFYAYVEPGRTPDITVTDNDGAASLTSVEKTDSDREDLDKYAITVAINDTSADLDLLVGNRWDANQVAYNYRTLHISFLREIQSLSLTGEQDGHYHVSYAATVNGQQALDTTAVNWYINTKLQPEHGLTLDRVYDQGGHYTVYAELGGLTSNTVENTIIYTAWQAIFWYALLVIVVVLAMLWVLRYTRTRGARMDVHLRTQMQEMLEALEHLQGDLVHEKITPAVAMRALLRMERRFSVLCDDLYERFRATNMAPYQQAAETLEKARNVTRSDSRSAEDTYYTRAALNACQNALKKALETLQDIAALSVR